jgi:hypothetical protein
MGVRNDDDDDEIDRGGLFLARTRARVGIAASVTKDPDVASSIGNLCVCEGSVRWIRIDPTSARADGCDADARG